MATDPRSTSAHKRKRKELLPFAYNTPCPRCGELMLKGQALDLGHSTDVADGANTIGDRIEHENCNRKAGAEAQQKRRKFNHSRTW